ncbi:hypothetical protein [Lysinibacillus sp. RS5]|uniref:hypothetical protein n=1 Tax=unclassified Lysinibacillus TaxID=2636778 RepID=UPI0035BE3820
MPDFKEIWGNGPEVIQNHILVLAVVMILVIVLQIIFKKITKMPNWLFKITFPIISFGVFVLVLLNYYLPGIASQIGFK